jgi:hypothetical protein
MFDEPVNGLDPEGILWIRNLMKALAAEGRTVFVSSHLMSEMENTADHLIVIGRGRLIADCTVEEFIQRNSEVAVRVRTPDSARLQELITADGGRVTSGADQILVTGVSAERIGDIAFDNAVRLHELAPVQASLEEAVMAITSEYATGMIRSTLQSQPRRFTVFGAKILVLGALMLAVGEVLAFAAYGVGKVVLSAHVPIHLSDEGVLRAVVGAGLYTAVLALFSLAAGAIFRHTAGGITAVLGLILVISPLTGLLPDTWGHYVSAYMPTNAGSLAFQQFVPSKHLLGPWQGIGVFAVETALLLALAAYLLRRRDA